MQKFFFLFRQFHNHFFFLTKITRHYFDKTYKIFEKFDRVSGTFSISSLKFLLKLASYYKKLQNMSQIFHPQWETIGLRFLPMGSCRTSDLFPTCLWTIGELCLLTSVRDFDYKCVLSLRVYYLIHPCYQSIPPPLYLPNLFTTDFFLFPKVKLVLEIRKNETMLWMEFHKIHLHLLSMLYWWRGYM